MSQMHHGRATRIPSNGYMKKRLLLVIIAIATVTVSVAAYYRANGAEDPPAFAYATVSRGDVIEEVEATGTLEAVNTVQVGTQVSGAIKTLHADFNARVRKGDVIARLEPSLFLTQVEQAQASVARVEAEADRARVTLDDATVKLRRARELWEAQLIARTDLEAAEAAARLADASLKSAQAQVTQARASLSQAQVNLGHTIIEAPIDGVVISRAVDVGQTVAASMSTPTLFVIANDLSQMRVNARIDEADVGRVAAGQRVRFTVDAYPGRTFTGTVSQVRLEPVTEQNVVSYVTIIDVPNTDLQLKPGMTATVTVEIARAENVLRVPNAALRFRPSPEGARVWVAGPDGRPRPADVRPGLSDGTVTALLDDSPGEGTRVITGAIAQTGATAQSSGSPLLPFGGRGAGGGSTGGRRGGPAQGAGG